MTDIIDRIKRTQCCDPVIDGILTSAKEEIEFLREELESAKAQVTIAKRSNGFQLLEAQPSPQAYPCEFPTCDLALPRCKHFRSGTGCTSPQETAHD